MLFLRWLGSSMHANGEPLQGNLFGEVVPTAQDTKSAQSNSSKQDLELTDNELVADAAKRPRKSLNKKTENLGESASSSNEEPDQSIKDEIPAWSNHKLVDPKELTPVLRHYVELKKANPKRILLYRLGDFFECFFEDAIELSRLLELTLTGKEAGKVIGRVPMAGVPYHAVDRYCADLINRGISVALCDQLETTPAKGSLIKRDITRVLTPGTVLEEGLLAARKNNWLAAAVIEIEGESNKFSWGLACADISTGEFLVTQREGASTLHQELAQLEAAELLYGKSDEDIEINTSAKWCPDHLKITTVKKTPFSKPEAEQALLIQFKLKTLDGFGIHEMPLAIRAAGGLLAYLKETQPFNMNSKTNASNESIAIPLDRPKCTYAKDFLVIDAQTRRNLEITATQRDGQFQGSLLWAIDRTLTAMGGRCLRRWLNAPLMDAKAIRDRQNIITTLIEKKELRVNLRRLLRSMSDLERLAGRAGAGHAGARDLVAISDGIQRLPLLSNQIKGNFKDPPSWISELTNINQELIDLGNSIEEKMVNNPPLSLSEGGLFHDGIDNILDGLRNQLDDHNSWLLVQEQLERKNSGNQNLRLQFHRTFGYFLSVSKAKAGTVPSHWIRRQTLTNEERFITPDLKAREGKIFQLKARIGQREYDLFCKLREIVGNKANSIRKSAKAVAGLDSLTSLADVAATSSYCCPEIVEEKIDSQNRIIDIKRCRHPVVEQLLVEKVFKPNDIKLGNKTDLIILTGPNASGKSCYLRQIGLIQLMAQIGSWVPAQKATLSLADRIFTRVGAVDDLSAGQSTFMVEMAETASILHHATNKSLVLLDEIGRGTATFDGLSIAWAVSEFLAKNLRSRTVFATHYHELNELSESLENVSNYQVLVKETGNSLIFLHQVVPGGANRSYGIEAARLAGVPEDVVCRARQILNQLESNNSSNEQIISKERIRKISIHPDS